MTPEALRDIDILVVKTPTEKFAADEIRTIHEYVESGGGLILIGDHTNVFGTGDSLNMIAKPLGFHFVYDCIFDQRSRFEFLYRTPASRRRHPILRDVETILFEVGCSIDIDAREVRPVIIGRGLKSQEADFGVSNFYPHPQDKSHLHYGQFPILVTRTYGRGRVAAISDSTLFSTFSTFMPGRREIVEGMVAFVNVEDIGATVRSIASRLRWAVALLLLLLVLRGGGVVLAVSAALLAGGIGNLTVTVAQTCLYAGNPELDRGLAAREVTFLWDDAEVDWPVYGFPDNQKQCFNLFFQYVTRTGSFPRLVRGLDEAISRRVPLILIDPSTDNAGFNADRLQEFVADGGSLILLESRQNALSDALAERFGLKLRPPKNGERSVRFLTKFGPVTSRIPRSPSRSIEGGEPLVLNEVESAGNERSSPGRITRAVGSVVKHGSGHYALLTCGQLFANSDYGFRYSTIPDDSLRRLYEFQYCLISAAAKDASRVRNQ